MKTMLAAAAMALSLTACSTPGASLSASSQSEAAQADFQRDRQAILAMAGDHRVMFDFKETAAFVPDYEPIKPKESGGYEIVRVIEDTGAKIALQHILVMEMDSGQTFIIKHWQQLGLRAQERARLCRGRSLESGSRAGRRCGGRLVADRLADRRGLRRAMAASAAGAMTAAMRAGPAPRSRMLARRDAVRQPPYDRYRSVNRHALTPKGWVHSRTTPRWVSAAACRRRSSTNSSSIPIAAMATSRCQGRRLLG